MTVPQWVLSSVPPHRFAIPKSLILTHSGDSDAIKTFYTNVSSQSKKEAGKACCRPVASSHDGKSPVDEELPTLPKSAT